MGQGGTGRAPEPGVRDRGSVGSGIGRRIRRRTGSTREQSHPHSRWITLMRVSSLMKRLGLKLSLNDPRWGSDKKDDNKPQANEGKKPGEGPPDMEQLWRDFNQRLNSFFGQKNRPPGNNGGDNNGGGGRGGGGGARPGRGGAPARGGGGGGGGGLAPPRALL